MKNLEMVTLKDFVNDNTPFFYLKTVTESVTKLKRDEYYILVVLDKTVNLFNGEKPTDKDKVKAVDINSWFGIVGVERSGSLGKYYVSKDISVFNKEKGKIVVVKVDDKTVKYDVTVLSNYF